jgi:penicillin-binding protein 2
MRHRQIIIVFKVLFIILILGLFYIQIIQGDYFYRLSKRNIIRVFALDAARGKILDRNGVVLADSVPSFNICIIPQETEDKPRLLLKISKLLDIPVEDLIQNYKKNYVNPFVPVTIYENLNKYEIITLEENKLNLPGILIDTLPCRIYPFHNVASHILGHLSEIA